MYRATVHVHTHVQVYLPTVALLVSRMIDSQAMFVSLANNQQIGAGIVRDVVPDIVISTFQNVSVFTLIANALAISMTVWCIIPKSFSVTAQFVNIFVGSRVRWGQLTPQAPLGHLPPTDPFVAHTSARKLY